MKIYCEHCGQDITVVTEKMIDNYKVGYVQCPHCKKMQKRYVSEADLLLYFGLSEVFYLLMSVIAMLVLNFAKTIWLMIVLILPLLVIGYFVQRYLIQAVYVNAYFKKDFKNVSFNENQEEIKRTISWQYLLFFAIAITFVTMEDMRLYFGIMSIAAVILTFIKFKLCLNREKSQIKGSSK